MDNCSVSCPNCGYTDNWDVPQSYQLDKEKNNGQNMPKLQMQHNKIRRDRVRDDKKIIVISQDERDRKG